MREREDDTGFGGRIILQGDGFSYGVDAVLLAAFASGETGAKVPRNRHKPLRFMDLGTGNGILPLILSHKWREREERDTFFGIEKNPEAAGRARRTMERNGLADRITIIEGDILEEAAPYYGTMDIVVSNPPYFRASLCNEEEALRDARHETTAGIDAFAAEASKLLTHRGDFYLIHRPSRLADIFIALRAHRLEPKEMQFVLPHPGRAANLVLIHAVKDAGSELKLLPELVVHEADGGYTEELLRLYERA